MRFFAVIPAAGRSVRMGQPKLLLPWAGTTVIEHVVAAWRASRASTVVLVAHPDDYELAERARACDAAVVQPEAPPPEMKDSVRAALAYIRREYDPRDPDAWLLAPADMPQLNAPLIDRVIRAYEASIAAGEPTAIWAPAFGGRRGHPVLFPWSLAVQVDRLGPSEGLNLLVARSEVRTIEVQAAEPADLDTPEDYERLRRDPGC
jgi:molybdenum cofactor cytidylyltransferase